MIRYIIQNCGKRADSDWIMIRNCNVMRAFFASRETNMASCLPAYSIIESTQSLDQIRA